MLQLDIALKILQATNLKLFNMRFFVEILYFEVSLIFNNSFPNSFLTLSVKLLFLSVDFGITAR